MTDGVITPVNELSFESSPEDVQSVPDADDDSKLIDNLPPK